MFTLLALGIFQVFANSCKEEALNQLPQCHTTVMSGRKPDLAKQMARFICRNFAVLGFGKYFAVTTQNSYIVLCTVQIS